MRCLLQDVKQAILADLAAAAQQGNGKQVSPFQPSMTARCKAVAMLLLLYAVVVPLSCVAVLAAAGVTLALRVLTRGSALEGPYARRTHKGTALVSGAQRLLLRHDMPMCTVIRRFTCLGSRPPASIAGL